MCVFGGLKKGAKLAGSAKQVMLEEIFLDKVIRVGDNSLDLSGISTQHYLFSTTENI